MESNNEYSNDLVSEKLVFSLNYRTTFEKNKVFLSDKTFKKKYIKNLNIKNIKNENFLKYFI